MVPNTPGRSGFQEMDGCQDHRSEDVHVGHDCCVIAAPGPTLNRTVSIPIISLPPENSSNGSSIRSSRLPMTAATDTHTSKFNRGSEAPSLAKLTAMWSVTSYGNTPCIIMRALLTFSMSTQLETFTSLIIVVDAECRRIEWRVSVAVRRRIRKIQQYYYCTTNCT